MTYQPKFRYYSIEYTYDYGKVTQGAYADKWVADMNADLNKPLSARVVEVWY